MDTTAKWCYNNRLLDRQGNLKNINKLESFLE